MSDQTNLTLPIDGHGGSLYDMNLTTPTYFLGEVNITWAGIEGCAIYNYRLITAESVGLGLCLASLVMIVGLTPSAKRGLPLYTFFLVALGCEIIRLLILIVVYAASVWGSIYYCTTGDPAAGSQNVVTMFGIVLANTVAPIAFAACCVCYYIQARAVMVPVKHMRPWLYKATLGSVIALSLVAFGWRVALSTVLNLNTTTHRYRDPQWLFDVVINIYMIAIIAWSLIFTIQVGIALYRRVKLNIRLQKSEVMGVLLLSSVESMIIPSKSCLLPL